MIEEGKVMKKASLGMLFCFDIIYLRLLLELWQL